MKGTKRVALAAPWNALVLGVILPFAGHGGPFNFCADPQEQSNRYLSASGEVQENEPAAESLFQMPFAFWLPLTPPQSFAGVGAYWEISGPLAESRNDFLHSTGSDLEMEWNYWHAPLPAFENNRLAPPVLPSKETDAVERSLRLVNSEPVGRRVLSKEADAPRSFADFDRLTDSSFSQVITWLVAGLAVTLLWTVRLPPHHQRHHQGIAAPSPAFRSPRNLHIQRHPSVVIR
jgi:hypothetical protein